MRIHMETPHSPLHNPSKESERACALGQAISISRK